MPRPRQSLLRCGVWLSSCLLIVGCGSPEVEDVPLESAETVAPELLETESILPTPADQGIVSEETATADAAYPVIPAEQSASTIYEPPNPERVELFSPPSNGSSETGQGRRDGQGTVELIGFVDVGGQKAVLKIDGLISPIASGEIRHGIEVISIQPPTVVWQRLGSRRVHASLEN